MKTRIISALIALTLLVLVIWIGEISFGLAVFALSLKGIKEFYDSFSKINIKAIKAVGYIACMLLVLLVFEDKLNGIFNQISLGMWIALSIFIGMLILSFTIVIYNKEYNLTDVAITIFGIVYVVFLFSFLILTRKLENGLLFMWLIFIGAWATDTFAYFFGISLGKRKLIPSISPKKTIEGSIGGILGCVIIMCLYGIYINRTFLIENIPLYNFVILGVISGIISQVGDLTASSIKRYVNIKDFGSIMPGHGGILDRFDSILFIAPAIYFYITLIIL